MAVAPGSHRCERCLSHRSSGLVWFLWALLALLVLATALYLMPGEQPPPLEDPVEIPIRFKIDDIFTDEASQQHRGKFIGTLKKSGFIERIDMEGRIPVIYVGETFDATSMELRAANLGPIFGYYWMLDNELAYLLLRRPGSPENFGHFSEEGLVLEQ